MSDVTAYILILGLIVLPSYALIYYSDKLLVSIYSVQSLVLTVPFP